MTAVGWEGLRLKDEADLMRRVVVPLILAEEACHPEVVERSRTRAWAGGYWEREAQGRLRGKLGATCQETFSYCT